MIQIPSGFFDDNDNLLGNTTSDENGKYSFNYSNYSSYLKIKSFGGIDTSTNLINDLMAQLEKRSLL